MTTRRTFPRALVFLTALVATFGLGSSAASGIEFTQPPGSPFSFAVGQGFLFSANGMDTGDLDGDGRSDVVTANWSPSSFSVMLAEAGGSLSRQAGSPNGLNLSVNDVALGDYDNDGDLDAAFSSYQSGNGSISVHAGNGEGNIAPAPAALLPAGTNANAIVTGDFNGDGIDDVASTDADADRVHIYLGVAGGFSMVSAGSWAVGPTPISATVGDFNGDGYDDIATANLDSFFSNAFSVLNSDGNGGYTATPAGGLEGSYRPTTIVSGRFDGSGNLGLAEGNSPNTDVPVKLGNGDGTFNGVAGPSIDSRFGGELVASDFDGDGIDDLIYPYGTSISGPSDMYSVFLGRSDGNMVQADGSPFSLGPLSGPQLTELGDFNGDGRPDFAVADYGTGMAVFLSPSPAISVSPDPAYFMGVKVGQGPSEPVEFTVTSSGEATLEISSVSLVGTDSHQFGVFSDGCSEMSLPPADTCKIQLTLDPTRIGELNADLRIEANLSQPKEVALTGWGIANPDIELDPWDADFGSRPVNAGPGSPVTFTVSSTGTTPLGVDTVAIEGDDPGQFQMTGDDCAGRTLPPGESCSIDVAFVPTAAGPASARLEVASDTTDGPLSANLEGIGTVSVPAVEVTPLNVDFGRIVVGQGPSATHVVTVRSTGSGVLHIGGAALNGTAPDQFRIVTDGCSGRELAPGSDCRVEIAFAPTMAGESSSRLEIPSDAAGGPSVVDLSGVGDSQPMPCEPVSVKKIVKYKPSVKRFPQRLGVRARLTTTASAMVRIEAKVKVWNRDRARIFRAGSTDLRIGGAYRNYKVPIPGNLRRHVRIGDRARMTISYASRALRAGCEFGPKRTRTLNTRIVLVWLQR